MENIIQKFQLNRIALVAAFAAFQVRFPLRRSDGHKTSAAEGNGRSIRIGAVYKEGPIY
jgi:hypothetical protein